MLGRRRELKFSDILGSLVMFLVALFLVVFFIATVVVALWMFARGKGS